MVGQMAEGGSLHASKRRSQTPLHDHLHSKLQRPTDKRPPHRKEQDVRNPCVTPKTGGEARGGNDSRRCPLSHAAGAKKGSMTAGAGQPAPPLVRSSVAFADRYGARPPHDAQDADISLVRSVAAGPPGPGSSEGFGAWCAAPAVALQDLAGGPTNQPGALSL